MKKKLALSAAVMLGLSATGHASEQEGWQVELTPYIWGANLDADITAGTLEGEVDNDLWENTDAGFMGMGIISYNRLVLYLDYNYLALSDDYTTKNGVVLPVGTKLKTDTDLDIITGGIGWRFDTWGEKNTIDVLVGVRTLQLDSEIDTPTGTLSRDDDVSDALLMLRPSIQLSENWRFNPTLSFGIDGDSETTYELMPQFQYNFSDSFAFRIGYKNLHYEIESGNKGSANYREFDGDFSGPFLGLGWTFPTREKPAPVVESPPPPPPPPAKCADTDNDGVCDSKDQCPNTPPGKRVGPGGCDCDYTLALRFAFNSAVLTAHDKAELDKLAEVLANPNLSFIAGTIVGHTDSVGKPAYNAKLSKRRAEAVAKYLSSKGVTLGTRFTTEGRGEDEPAADNRTEAGRAENRRVVISRSDCGPAQ